jgi:hypothetical protein
VDETVDVEISVVRGEHPYGETPSRDTLLYWSDISGDFEDEDDLLARWEQACTIAAALNRWTLGTPLAVALWAPARGAWDVEAPAGQRIGIIERPIHDTNAVAAQLVSQLVGEGTPTGEVVIDISSDGTNASVTVYPAASVHPNAGVAAGLRRLADLLERPEAPQVGAVRVGGSTSVYVDDESDWEADEDASLAATRRLADLIGGPVVRREIQDPITYRWSTSTVAPIGDIKADFGFISGRIEGM